MLAAGLALWWWRPFRVAVEGASMAPALLPGDFLVAVRPRKLIRGSLVVVERRGQPGFEVVKRLTALPGEAEGNRILGPDEYWVIGDRIEASTDSRSFGPVPRAAIRGVVKIRYWPVRRLGIFRESTFVATAGWRPEGT